MYKSSSFSALPEVIKNLLIINGLLFFATISLENYGINLTQIFGLHQFQSSNFMPHQLITHFFMHGNFSHLFFNMFALWMFGKILENIWGAKRFLIYYIITGIGAAFSFVLSASSNFPHEVWRNEDGSRSEIVNLIGSRNF